MLSDDVFRECLEQTLVELESWANGARDRAKIDVAATRRYWRMSVDPHFPGGCPFELLIKSDQTFSLKLADEVYEDRPVTRFDLFSKLAAAVVAGGVEQTKVRNALTDILVAIESRVELDEGWDWIGERLIAPRTLQALQISEVRRTHRFLPYARYAPESGPW
jgi:hypothetical protein